MRAMKHSGVEWIGEIPEGWSLCKLRNLVVEVREKNSPIKTTRVLSLTNKLGVIPYEDKGNQGNKAKEEYDEYHIAYERTIVANSMNILIGSVGLSQYYGCVSPVYYVYRNLEEADIEYVNYIFQNEGFQKELRKYANGIMEIRLRVSSFDILRRTVPNPPFAVQKLISDTLNAKCAEIDKVVEKTRATIEEYKKLKQAIITEAVTKGVRGPRPMKPSGVEWIGDIPEEWELQKAKYNIIVSHGCDPKTEGNVPVYGSGASSFRTCGEFKKGPTVLVGRKGATLHIPHFITGRYWNVDTAFDVKTDASKFSLRYYYYLATSFDYKYYISQTTLPGMTQSNYLQMKLPVPPVVEQQEIVAYLDTKCAEIDRIIGKKEQLIEELGSYKKSLIYEYVTGKKQVLYK